MSNWWEPFKIVQIEGIENAPKIVIVLAIVLNLAWVMLVFGCIAFAIGIGLRLAL